jgi:hypothetical protein
MSDIRVMLTCAIIGHAAGTGAALSVLRGTTPRGVYKKHMSELQQKLMRDGSYIIGEKNTDPEDLARKARPSASSSGPDPLGKPTSPDAVLDGHARALGSDSHAWYPDPSAQQPHRLTLSWPEPAVFNSVQIIFQTAKLAPAHVRVQVEQDGEQRIVYETDTNRRHRMEFGFPELVAGSLAVFIGEPAGICEVRVYRVSQDRAKEINTIQAVIDQKDSGPYYPWEMQIG